MIERVPVAIPTAMSNRNVTTGMKKNPISHPPIVCSHDLFGAVAFAFQMAKPLNGAERAIITAVDA